MRGRAFGASRKASLFERALVARNPLRCAPAVEWLRRAQGASKPKGIGKTPRGVRPVPSSLSPELRSQRARIGAHAQHAKHDARQTTAAARAAADQRFEDEVDPDRVLPEDERARRAAHARSAYFTRLAYQSAKARAARTAGADPEIRRDHADPETARKSGAA